MLLSSRVHGMTGWYSCISHVTSIVSMCSIWSSREDAQYWVASKIAFCDLLSVNIAPIYVMFDDHERFEDFLNTITHRLWCVQAYSKEDVVPRAALIIAPIWFVTK